MREKSSWKIVKDRETSWLATFQQQLKKKYFDINMFNFTKLVHSSAFLAFILPKNRFGHKIFLRFRLIIFFTKSMSIKEYIWVYRCP